jgi:hypothetical protein
LIPDSTIPIRLVKLRTIVRVRSLSFALLAALAVAAPRAARADGGGDAAHAKELFEQGRELRSRGNCADALPFFQRAFAAYPAGLGSLRNVAVCQETLGRPTAARKAWLDLRRAVAASTDPKYAGWVEDADRAAAHLAPKVALLAVDLDVVDPAGGTGPSFDAVDVTIDGQAVTRAELGAPIEHDPGPVTVRATGPGIGAPDQQSFTLAAGVTQHVLLHVTLSAAVTAPDPGAASSISASVDDTDPNAARRSRLRTGAWIATGVGAAGLAGALIALSFRQSALGALGSDCPEYATSACAASKQAIVTADVNRGRTASTMFDAFGVVAVAGAAASVTLFTFAATSSGHAAVVVAPTSVGAMGTF